MNAHWQHDGRRFAIWGGIRWNYLALGIAWDNTDDVAGWSFGVRFGPLYAGAGGYDR